MADVVAPSAIMCDESVTSDKSRWRYQMPHALTTEEAEEVVQQFQRAMKRAVDRL
ncbi:hypothetical protein [Cricetibacter osteomyelitidis]|uniref:hypothetical protein n=1 Tax=Cricetibacter osteomyelitidis TaxID=1521931 RepID=UPI001FB1BDEF|nr:hypothetical protein [Cricetibacter osteomyelitidis]